MVESEKTNSREVAVEKVRETLNTLKELHGGAWVLVRTFASREKSIAVAIENRVESAGLLNEAVFDIRVPEETITVIDLKGKRKISRVRQPGYVLINMDIYNEEAVLEVRHTNGVLGYAGGGNEPIELTDDEVIQFLMPSIDSALEAQKDELFKIAKKSTGAKHTGAKVEIDFAVGETVMIVDGPFAQTTATISKIDFEHEKVQLILSMFGRETTIDDVSIAQIRKNIF